MSQARSPRAAISICSSLSLCRRSKDPSKWRVFAVQRLGCRNVKTLSRISLWCWGVTATTKCESLIQDNTPGQKAPSFRPSLGPQKPLETFLKKIHFIIHAGVRSFILFCRFGPLLIVYPLTYLSARMNSLWLRLLLKAMESSGPACIKLGQWASTRRDLFSEEFCILFSKLHVKVTPHPWEYTELCLRRAFGNDYARVLTITSRDPVGSGCVAQVYKAYADLSAVRNVKSHSLVESMERDSAYEAWEVPGLHGVFGRLRNLRQRGQSSLKDHECSPIRGSEEDPGHLVSVAVKILHPGLGQQVKMDLLIMKTWSKLLSLIPGFRWLSLTEIVEEFEKLMTQQLDLRFEAKNLETFQQKFEKMDFIKFPTPLRPFVTKNILVETFEDGEPLSLYLNEKGSYQVKQRIAAMGVDMLLKMIFVDNFVHADLHPGNILVQGAVEFSPRHSDQTTLVDMCDTLIVDVRPSRCPLRLVLLDAGIVAELQEKDLENFHSVFTAVVLGQISFWFLQGETVAELIMHHARANQCTNVESFKSQMAELVNEARKNTVALGKLQVAALLSQVFQLLMTHKVKLESNFASIVFAILVLEGLGRTLDPELNILEAAKPLLLKSAASLI